MRVSLITTSTHMGNMTVKFTDGLKNQYVTLDKQEAEDLVRRISEAIKRI